MKTTLLIVALMVSPAFAQREPVTPQLDAVSKQFIAHVNQTAKLADAACKELPEMKIYESARTLLDAQISRQYPGMKLDQRGALVSVTPPAPAPTTPFK